MQITDQSLRVLGGYPGKNGWIEIKDQIIRVPKSAKFDPIIAVALGVRLLGHKYSQIPSRYPKNSKSMIIGYHSFDLEGEKYADVILKKYNESRAP